MTDKPFPWMLNRRVAAMEPEFLGGEELTKKWVVCDRFSPPRAPAESEDPRGNPTTYGCEDMLLTVTKSDTRTWVVCNDRGQFLRTTGWAGENRRIRRFKSPQAAAAFAETVPEFERPTCVQPAEPTRTWWFLENHDGEWLENEPHGDFTRDPNKAMKWPNAQAATQARNRMRSSLWAILKLEPTAHRWLAPATQQPGGV